MPNPQVRGRAEGVDPGSPILARQERLRPLRQIAAQHEAQAEARARREMILKNMEEQTPGSKMHEVGLEAFKRVREAAWRRRSTLSEPTPVYQPDRGTSA